MKEQEKLPNEILASIFKLLPRQTLYQCIIVCKNWTSAAVEEYYKYLYINGKQITRIKVILASASSDDQITKVIGKGEYVKTLGFIHDHYVARPPHQNQVIFNNKELDILLSQMPYLTKIDLEQSSKVELYLKELVKFHQKLKYVQEIWIPMDNKLSQCHIEPVKITFNYATLFVIF